MAIEGLFYVHAFVSDLARSKRFYGEVLGWTLGTDEPGVAGFQFGSGYLVAIQDERPPADRLYPGGMSVAVKVDDLDAQHARLAGHGIEVGSIRSQPWGERSFSFADPDGYEWVYGQPAG